MDEVLLKFIGTGDSESLNFHNTNMLLTKQRKHLLIDCGWTAKRALHEQGLSIRDIDAIFITHVHGDHVFGLERFGFESRYVYSGYRMRLYVPESVLPFLWDECLKGSMGYSAEGRNELQDFFDVQVVRESFSWQGLDFDLFPTTHTKGKPSFGVRLPHRFTFTSDTNVIPDFELIVQDDPYVFHDIYLSGSNHPAHATPNEMKQAYSSGLLSRIQAVHYGDDIGERETELHGFAGWVRQGEVFQC